ncbi:MAG: substrate-binding domain-containing protein [Propionibacteriaceae bacterium]|nr:substrate-binding domain-containing protein [Propionibacteriaceae bacterium]
MPFRFSWAAAGVIVTALALTACQSPQPEPPTTPPSPTVAAAGPCPPGDLLIETTPADQQLLEAQATDYSTGCQNRARLTVGSARDGGTTSFVNGLVHIAATDLPLADESLRQAETRCLRHPAWHLPVAADPIAIVFRVDGVTDLSLRPVTLAKVFSGVITHWNDPEIAADNPTVNLPDARIEVFFRSGRTGATQAVGDYLNRAAPDAWPVGGTPSWRGAGQARASAQEVFDAVATTANGIGYVEQSQLPQPIVGATPTPTPTPTDEPGAGESSPSASPTPTATQTPDRATPHQLRLLLEQPLELTEATAEAGITALAPRGEGHDLLLASPTEASSGAWPLMRVSYQVVCSAGQRADLTPLERDWVTYLVSDDVQDELVDAGRLPLPSTLRERVRAAATALN